MNMPVLLLLFCPRINSALNCMCIHLSFWVVFFVWFNIFKFIFVASLLMFCQFTTNKASQNLYSTHNFFIIDQRSKICVVYVAMYWFSSALSLWIGGWVGYFSYDTVRYVEKKKLPFLKAPEDDRNLPDVHLGLYDDVIVFDHVEKVVLVNFYRI